MGQEKAKVPTLQHERLPVSWKQVIAFRLSRHHLLDRATREDLVSVVGDMTGAQAQLLPAAQLSLRPRVRDLQIADVDAALSERTLVKASAMRRTLFLLPSEQLAVFVRGSAGRAEKVVRWTLEKGVPERVVDAAIDTTLGALDEPRTRPEIAERVSRALGVQMQSVQGGGWGSRSKVAAVPVGDITFPVSDLLHLVGARGVVCYGPNRGNEPTFVRADAWIPHWQDTPREEAERLLLRWYLRAHGPATPADFYMWTGMSLKGVRQIWADEQAALAQVDVEGWEATVLREDLDELRQAGFERPLVRLLPYFDSFLLGHKEREHLVAAQDRPKVYRPQGWIAPVVLVDGRITAVWAHAREGNRLRVRVEKFGPTSRGAISGIRAEAQDLGRFLEASDVDVEFG
jgi:hypothetical protein